MRAGAEGDHRSPGWLAGLRLALSLAALNNEFQCWLVLVSPPHHSEVRTIGLAGVETAIELEALESGELRLCEPLKVQKTPGKKRHLTCQP